MMKFKPFLWKKAKGDGTRHIKIYIAKDREVTYYPLGVFIASDKLGNDYMQWVPSNVANALKINLKIKSAIDKFQAIYLNNPNISITEIKEVYDKGDKDLDFYSFYEDQLELQKKKISKGTAKAYGQLRESLKGFSPELYFNSIDYEFLSRYEGHMKESGLLQTTVYKRMKTLRMYIHEAFRMGKIKSNPFGNYKLKDGKSTRVFLDEESILKIKNAKKLTAYEKEARTKFFFQCYTGLSFSDLMDLKWSEIRDNVIYRERIKTIGQTAHSLVIPLIPEALEILNKQKRVGECVFSKISNQKYNEFLHSIEAKAELAIPMTSHVARHTFATKALESGISLATVSSILGHSNIRTTQIYAKVTKKLKEEEMKKLKF